MQPAFYYRNQWKSGTTVSINKGEDKMKVIILAGGLPSTLIEEDEKIPKPMAEIGGRPILWHIMKQYSYYGYRDFIICTGYKGSVIKDYFMNFYIYQSDITVDLQTNHIEVHRKQTEDWKVSVIDTGINSSIPVRLQMVRNYIDGEAVLVTYGDCLSDINIREMVEAHRSSDHAATVAVAHPTGRNEILSMDTEGRYQGIRRGDGDAWVNACSLLLEPAVFDSLEVNMQSRHPMSLLDCLSQKHEVHTYCHDGFWSPVETVRDRTWMEKLWTAGEAPWKVWLDE